MKDIGEYHDLHVQSHALLLADVFQNFRNICFQKLELEHARFLLNQDEHGKQP